MDALWTTWWAWVSAGLVFAILEMIIPGYIFLGFAVGAVFIGLGLAAGIVGISLPWMLVLFAGASLAAFLIMRKVFGLRNGQVKIWDRDIND